MGIIKFQRNRTPCCSAFHPQKYAKKCSCLTVLTEQTLLESFGNITDVCGNKILSRFWEMCGDTATFCCEKTSVLRARPHLLFHKKLDSWSLALNVKVLFLSNCDKYSNHKHFIPQFFLCWKRDRTNSRKRVVTNYFDKMRTAISGRVHSLFSKRMCFMRISRWDFEKNTIVCVKDFYIRLTFLT